MGNPPRWSVLNLDSIEKTVFWQIEPALGEFFAHWRLAFRKNLR